MQVYEVQEGDSPALIAIKYAGCPKCAVDLVRANPHKQAVVFPNGFTTFRDLRAGERLNLPDKWFNGALDGLPPAYFQSLPYADGVTRGAVGTLGDYPELDTATSKVGALAAMDDATFSAAVGDAGNAINAAIKEAYGSANTQAAQLAQTVQSGTQWAWNRNNELAAAIASGDAATITQARLDITNALATALGNAHLALNAYFGPSPPTPGASTVPSSTFVGPSVPVVKRPSGPYSASLQDAANAAVAAMAADPNYCMSVAQPGSTVNAAVHAFKLAWNASQSLSLPLGTGNYEASTASALAKVTGSAPAACGVKPSILPQPFKPLPVAQQTAPKGLSTGELVGIGVLGAAAVGGVVYVATRGPAAPKRRRPFRYRKLGMQVWR